MTFDPVAATNTLLATLPAAMRAKAVQYTQGGHWLLLWGWAVGVVAYVIIARSRVLVRTEVAIERRRPHLLVVSFVVAALTLILDAVIELPWTVYAQWWRERSYGLTSQPLSGWLGEQAIGLGIGVVLGGLFAVGLYALIRRARRFWWAWASAMAAAAIIVMTIVSPILIEPLFNTYKPAPPGPHGTLWWLWRKRLACPTTRSTSTTALNSQIATPPTSRDYLAQRAWR